jgi:hypothetical protein
LVVIVVTFTVIIVIHLDPLANQFLASLVIGLLVTRLLWIIESQLMLNLMLGYELDRALFLRKTEPSFFDNASKLWIFSSGKVFDSSEKGDPPTSSVSNTHHQTIGAGSVDDQLMMKGLEKYSKMKNKAELDGEIERVKEQIKRHQVELACLENMIFASEHDSKSQSQSGRKSSHGQISQLGNRHSQVEGGGGPSPNAVADHGESWNDESGHVVGLSSSPEPAAIPLDEII